MTIFGFRIYEILKAGKGLALEPEPKERRTAIAVGIIGGIIIPLVLLGLVVFQVVQKGDFMPRNFEPSFHSFSPLSRGR